MKINKIMSLIIVSLVLMLSACDPIVDQAYLKNTTDATGVQLSAIQSTSGGNEIEFYMETPGITGYWDYMIGKGLTDRVTVTFPVTGNFEFKYVGTLGAEFFEKTTSVNIEVLDHPVEPEWAALLGDDAVAGKTWVFDGVGGDDRLWYYMSPPNDPSAWESAWWNAGGSCCPPGDVNGKMSFDLNKGANYTYYADASGEPQLGNFVLNLARMTLTITGSNILGSSNPGEGGYNPDGIFNIISLTDNEMILYIPDGQWDSGWTYKFKPE